MRSFLHSPLAVLCSLAALLLLQAAPAHAQAPAPTNCHDVVGFKSAALDNTTLDADVLVLDPACATSDKAAAGHFSVPNKDLQAQLKTIDAKKDDVLAIVTDAQGTLQSVRVKTSDLSLSGSVFVLTGCAALYMVLSLVLTLGNPMKLVIGEDGHYSNSKFQIFLWFGILISSYLASFLTRGQSSHWTALGNIAIPTHLGLLSGMSALTFAGAKGITTSKVQTAINAGIPDPKRATTNPRFLSDLMHNDNNKLDFGDFQMIVVTLVAVGMYVVLILHYLSGMELRAATSLPDVDTTILASFGLGQGAYLTKKAVGQPGDT